jgi:hypothetical protein
MSQNQSIHSHSQNVIGSQSSAILSIFDGNDDVDNENHQVLLKSNISNSTIPLLEYL